MMTYTTYQKHPTTWIKLEESEDRYPADVNFINEAYGPSSCSGCFVIDPDLAIKKIESAIQAELHTPFGIFKGQIYLTQGTMWQPGPGLMEVDFRASGNLEYLGPYVPLTDAD